MKGGYLNSWNESESMDKENGYTIGKLLDIAASHLRHLFSFVKATYSFLSF